MNKKILVMPRMSEKAYATSEALNTYVFEIPVDANKFTVAEAVEAQYNVKVTNVRIANIAGKSKKSYKKRGRAMAIKRNNTYKAYVTIDKKDKLPFFATAETAVAEDKETK